MIKRFYLPIILMVILVTATGICLHALVEYGHDNNRTFSHSQVHPGAGSSPGRPAMSGQIHQGEPLSHTPIQPNAARPGSGPAPPLQHGDPNKSGPANDYGLNFLLYFAAGFLLLAGLVYYLYARGKINLANSNIKFTLLALLVLGLLFRLYLATMMEGHAGDLAFFRNWSAAAAQGLTSLYSNTRCDYPPLYIYVLWLVGKISALAVLQPYSTILLKLPSILADLATAWLIYGWSRERMAPETSVLLTSFYIFNPAVFINSTLWGQVDSFFTLLIALAIWALTKARTGPAAALFTAAVLMKPQGIIFLPVLAFELLRQRNLKTIIKAALWAVGTSFVITLPFAWQQAAGWIIYLLTGTIGEYPYASVNAFNLFYLLGANYVPDSQVPFLLSYHYWGMLFIILTTLICWWLYVRSNDRNMAATAALLLITGVFTLGPSMHERYLFPAIALVIIAFIGRRDSRLLLLAIGFSLSIFVNTAAILFGGILNSSPIPQAASLLNLLLLGGLLWMFYDMSAIKRVNLQ